MSSKGIHRWSGYSSTRIWIEPAIDLFGLFMTSAWEIDLIVSREVQVVLYGAVE